MIVDPWFYAAALPAALLRQLLPAGLVGIVIGWLSFGLLPAHVVGGITGAVTLAFLAWQLKFPAKADAPPPGAAACAGLALTSGYTSFVAHSGGPPIVMALLPRRMAPLAYAGTSAVFFAGINAAKWLPYGLLGIWATKHVSPRWFYRLVQWGMFLTGVKLLWDGLR